MPDQELTLTDLPVDTFPPQAAAQFRRWLDTETVLKDIHTEREAQFEQWGDQDLPMGTHTDYKMVANTYRELCQAAMAEGKVTYALILLEEVFEALAETEPLKLRDELIQVAAVAVKMAELVDRHHPTPAPAGQADSA